MNVSVDEKKIEAIERMKLLKIHPNPIREFRDEGLINFSERGILYWIDNEEWVNKIHEIEEEYNILVYHAIFNYTEFGDLLSLLYVSDDKDEWELDRADMMDGYVSAYVINMDDPGCSEFGSICVKERFGGLIRTE